MPKDLDLDNLALENGPRDEWASGLRAGDRKPVGVGDDLRVLEVGGEHDRGTGQQGAVADMGEEKDVGEEKIVSLQEVLDKGNAVDDAEEAGNETLPVVVGKEEGNEALPVVVGKEGDDARLRMEDIWDDDDDDEDVRGGGDLDVVKDMGGKSDTEEQQNNGGVATEQKDVLDGKVPDGDGAAAGAGEVPLAEVLGEEGDKVHADVVMGGDKGVLGQQDTPKIGTLGGTQQEQDAPKIGTLVGTQQSTGVRLQGGWWFVYELRYGRVERCSISHFMLMFIRFGILATFVF